MGWDGSSEADLACHCSGRIDAIGDELLKRLFYTSPSMREDCIVAYAGFSQFRDDEGGEIEQPRGNTLKVLRA